MCTCMQHVLNSCKCPRSNPNSRRPLGRVWVDTAWHRHPSRTFWPRLRRHPSKRNTVARATFQRGWRQQAAQATHAAQQAELLTHLDPASEAMLASQTGPFASRTFTTIPWGHDLTYPSHLFRLLLLRRLRLPLPLSERSCRCRRFLDPLGDQRAACPRAGRCSAKASWPVGKSSRESLPGGWCPGRHKHNSHPPEPPELHPIRQPVHRSHSKWPSHPPRSTIGCQHYLSVPSHTQRRPPRPRRPVPWGSATTGRCRLIVLGVEARGTFSNEAANFVGSLAHARARSAPVHLKQATVAASVSRWSAILAHAAMHAVASSCLLRWWGAASHQWPCVAHHFTLFGTRSWLIVLGPLDFLWACLGTLPPTTQ